MCERVCVGVCVYVYGVVACRCVCQCVRREADLISSSQSLIRSLQLFPWFPQQQPFTSSKYPLIRHSVFVHVCLQTWWLVCTWVFSHACTGLMCKWVDVFGCYYSATRRTTWWFYLETFTWKKKMAASCSFMMQRRVCSLFVFALKEDLRRLVVAQFEEQFICRGLLHRHVELSVFNHFLLSEDYILQKMWYFALFGHVLRPLRCFGFVPFKTYGRSNHASVFAGS